VAGIEVRVVLRVLRPPLQEVASEMGVGYDTVKGWSSGRSRPTPENRRALAEYVRRHAEGLLGLAAQLEEGKAAPSPASSSPGAIRNRIDPSEEWVADEGLEGEELTEAERHELLEEVEGALCDDEPSEGR
jgi:transcriptional regulator with XRE-family HTH domain